MNENDDNRANITLSDRDIVLLDNLQDNARLTNTELAELTELSPSGLLKRLRKLEERRVIKQYTALVDRTILGYDLVVFIQVTLSGHIPEAVQQFDAAIQEMPQVLECYRITGNADYLLKVVSKNHHDLDNFLMNQLMTLPFVDRVHSNLVLREIKETTKIPLDGYGGR